MKSFIVILFTALLAWLASWAFSWWMVAAIPFIMAVVLKQKPGKAFISGAVSIALLWAALITRADTANEYILSSRMAQLFGLGHVAFILVNIIVGTLVGGLGGWSGACMTKIYPAKK